MRKVLLTTSAIVGLTAPVFAADPTAVSDQPYFHHAHPMSWSGSMSISLTNLSNNDANDATLKGAKKEFYFSELIDTMAVGAGTANSTAHVEEQVVGRIITTGDADNGDITDAERNARADAYLASMASSLKLHASYTTATITGSSVWFLNN